MCEQATASALGEPTSTWVTVHDVPTGERVPLGHLPYEVLITNTRPDRHRVRAVLGRRTLVVQVDGATCLAAPVHADARPVVHRGGCVAANGTLVTVEVRRLPVEEAAARTGGSTAAASATSARQGNRRPTATPAA